MTTEQMLKENEKLKEILEKYREETESLHKTLQNQMQTIANLRKEVLKDFAELLKEEASTTYSVSNSIPVVLLSDIKRIYIEKTGEKL